MERDEKDDVRVPLWRYLSLHTGEYQFENLRIGLVIRDNGRSMESNHLAIQN